MNKSGLEQFIFIKVTENLYKEAAEFLNKELCTRTVFFKNEVNDREVAC